MHIDFLLDVFTKFEKDEAVVWRGRSYTYGWLLSQYQHWATTLKREGVTEGTVAVVEADFSPTALALSLALTEAGCIFVPLTSSVRSKIQPASVRARLRASAVGEKSA